MSHSTLRSGSNGDHAESKVVHSHPSLDWVANFQAADDSVSVRRSFAGPYVSRLEVREERPVSALPADGVTLPLEVYDPLGEVAGGGHSVRRAGLFSYHAKASVQLVAISLSNISFCLAVAAFPMRVSGVAWYVTFIATGVAAWSGALFFLWQKRESTNERFQAFVLQEGFVYSRMIEIYIWTWIGILYCLYVAGLTLATLPLHFDSATLPGSRGYMWVLNLFLSFPHLLAFDPVSSTKAFKEAAVRKGYPGAAYFHDGYLSRTALLAAIVSVFAGLWVLACSPVGLFAQSDYDLYALYAVTALNVVLMFQILPRYANMCKSADALVHAEKRRWKRVDRNAKGKHGTLNQQARELRRPPSHMSSRVGEVVLAAVSTRMAFDQDATENSIGAASFRWGRNKGQGLGDETRRERADTHKQLLLPGEDEQSHHGMRWALRQTWNPLVTVALGLWSMPHGAVILVLNVTASMKHIWHTWRWLAATRPEKFLLAAGYLIAGLFLWPVLEVKLTDNAASMICNGLAFVLTLSVDLAMLSGRLSKADQEMILHAAEEGENVGSGLVFSTASLLNALVSGGSLAAGYVATEERLVDSTAISCRWDIAASWVLTVEQTAGRPPLKCTIMFSREQLHRAALVAWRDSCRYMWIDTLSVPQPSPDDDPQLAARKEALLRRLVPTMTSVYATVRHVLIVETECGLELGPNCYSGRTWTLQECVINPRTAVVQLDGMLSILGPPSKRLAYTGLDPTFSTEDLDDLGSYLWVLSGEERHAAQSTTPMQRAAFQGFANTRSAARSADKAVALGQIYFRMLFEHADVATRFMHEVAVLLAEQDGPPLLLIDNTGWEPGTMSGSADPGRVLMGRPGPLDENEWWLCKLYLGRTVVPVAIKPGSMDYSGQHPCGFLWQMRTCTEAEKAQLESGELEKLTVTWL
eukprot:jgi/Tetstr1/461545/TSEL_006651.t1